MESLGHSDVLQGHWSFWIGQGSKKDDMLSYMTSAYVTMTYFMY